MRLIIPGSGSFKYQFDVATCYAAGQAIVLSRAEARALNGLRAECLQRNRGAALKRAEADAPGGLLTRGVLDAFQAELVEYDAQYEFSDPEDEPIRLGSIEQVMAQIVAEQELVSVTGDNLTNIEQEARRRLLARQKVAERALEEL